MNRAYATSPARVSRFDQAADPRAGPAGELPAVAVFGEWNTRNLGDRAIRRAACRFFSGCGWRPIPFCLGSLSAAGEDITAADGDGGAPGSVAPASLYGPVKCAVRGIWQKVRLRRLLPQLAGVRAISIGGGALLSDDNLHFPQSLVELVRYARASGKPLLCLGCSAEGEWSGQGAHMIREFLDGCSVVAVRDADTARRLARALGPSPAVMGDFCLAETCLARGPREPTRPPAVAINASQLSGRWSAAQAALENALVALARRTAMERGANVRIFTTGLPEDAVAARRVYLRLAAVCPQLSLPATTEQLSALIGSASVVVATRLHGAILALAGNAPVLGLAVAPKLSSFFSTMGIPGECHGLHDVRALAERLSYDDFEQLLSRQRRDLAQAPVWRERDRLRERLALAAAACGASRREEEACG